MYSEDIEISLCHPYLKVNKMSELIYKNKILHDLKDELYFSLTLKIKDNNPMSLTSPP